MVRVRPDRGRLPFAAPPLVRSDVLDESDITLLEKALNLESEAVIEGCRTDNGPGWMALMLADAERMLAAVPPNAAIGGFAKVGPIGPNGAGATPDSKFGPSHP